MSASQASLPPRLSFHDRLGPRSDNLQIRVVPYSPSCPDSPASPRVASFIGHKSHQEPSDRAKEQGRGALSKGSGRIVATLTSRASASTTQKGHGNDEKPPGAWNRLVMTTESINQQPLNRQLSLASSPSISSSPSPWRRPKRAINIHADGTFSLVQHHGSISSRTDSSSLPSFSYATPSGSQLRMSSATATTLVEQDQMGSPLAPLKETPQEALLPCSRSGSPVNSDVESPRNYLLSSGVLRPFTYGAECVSDGPGRSEPSQRRASVAGDGPCERTPAFTLATKSSFQSSLSCSTVSERTNYRIYARSSPRSSSANDFTGLEFASLPPSSGSSKGVSHCDNASVARSDDASILPPDQSGANYVLHSRSRSSSILNSPRSPFSAAFSQESLVVAPLRPKKQTSAQRLLHTKSLSYDSTVTTSSETPSSGAASLRSLASSILRDAPYASNPNVDIWQDEPGNNSQAISPSDPGAHRNSLTRKNHWSTTLSTVMSEGENGSDRSSRSLSPLFYDSRGPTPFGHHSRRFGSFSSSLAGLGAHASHSRTTSLDRPPAVYSRELVQYQRLIRDHDEDGDGLADLEDVHRRLSRVRRHNSSSSCPSDRTSFSSHSSRSSRFSRSSRNSARNSRANSVNRGSLPQWARLYYGSEEYQLPVYKPSHESMASSFRDEQPRNPLLSRSPSLENYATDINNPRKRTRECSPADSDDISEINLPHPLLNIALNVKKKTSSVWSPHLRRDRRAGQHSIWTASSLAQCDGTPSFWIRHAQIVIFVAGFLLPFAWMIGAALPLPEAPTADIVEPDRKTDYLQSQSETCNQQETVQTLRLRDRVKWWRGVNRRMSIPGVLLVTAYIALTIAGVHQEWATS